MIYSLWYLCLEHVMISWNIILPYYHCTIHVCTTHTANMFREITPWAPSSNRISSRSVACIGWQSLRKTTAVMSAFHLRRWECLMACECFSGNEDNSPLDYSSMRLSWPQIWRRSVRTRHFSACFCDKAHITTVMILTLYSFERRNYT